MATNQSIEHVVVSLRDGRKLYGILRSFDQFANLVLQDSIERIFIQGAYGEEARGVYIVRGENVALIGEFDPALRQFNEDNKVPGSLASLKLLPYAEVEKLWKESLAAKKKSEISRKKAYKKYGMIGDFVMDNLY